MKLLLAVVSCHTREEFSSAVRDTWLPLVPPELEVKFFRGRGALREPLVDEVFLDCDDSYAGLPNKVQEIMRWAYAHGYDFCAKVDDDVVVKPRELLSSDFSKYEFTGCQEPACKPGEIVTPFGFFYWLSRKSMEAIIAAPLPGEPGSHWNHRHNNDEAYVSSVLHYKGVTLHHDPRYHLHRGDPPARAKRSLRSPLRFSPPPANEPVPGSFVFCVYLNWKGFHMTPKEELLAEFYKLFERHK